MPHEQLLMKRAGFVERMKTKNFYIVLGFILLSSGTIWLLSYPSPTFQNIVTKTHKGIKNLPNNIQIQVGGAAYFTPSPSSHMQQRLLSFVFFFFWVGGLGLGGYIYWNQLVHLSVSRCGLAVGAKLVSRRTLV